MTSTPVRPDTSSHQLYRDSASAGELRELIDSVDHGLCLFNGAGELLLANRWALELLGYPDEETYRRESLAGAGDVIREDGTPFPFADQPVAVAAREQRAVQNVVLGYHRPGLVDRVWLLMDAWPTAAPGSGGHVVCSFRDFGEHKRAVDELTNHHRMMTELEQRTEDELRASRAFLRRITDAVPGAVYRLEHTVDDKPYFSFISEGAQDLFDVPLEDLLVNADLIFQGMSEAQKGAARRGLERARERQERWNHEFSIETSTGKKWIRASAVPERPAPGTPVAFNGLFLDITIQKRMERALHNSQKMEAVGALAAGVAHNFNNTLAGILPNLEFCLERCPEELKGALEDASRAARTAVDVVEQLMILSRKDRATEHVLFKLEKVLSDVVAMCRRTFDSSIRIDFEAPSGALPVLGRASQIHQVILNLCINSRDAVSEAEQPHIGVSVRQVPAFSAEIVAVPSHLDYVVVSVTDNGCGMDEHTLGRVGEPFFTTKAPGSGTGLGLSSAFGILKEHGGNVECESIVGQGTTFSVWLPLAAGVPDSTRAANDTTLHDANTRRDTVLLIDDEPTVRRAYSRLLERSGYTVVGASDGERGLELFAGAPEKYAVVLLDLSMPKISGAEVLQKILQTSPNARVIILTGHAAPSHNLQGAFAVLKKPVTRARLLEELEAIRP